MKPFYTTRHEAVLTEIQQLEYKLELLRAELTTLEPLATSEKDALRAERNELARNVQVELEGGVFVTTEQHEKIRNGELIVEVKRPRPPRVEVVEPIVEPIVEEPIVEPVIKEPKQ